MNSEPDWTLWRSFAAVVRGGSLSAAARSLGVSQPTVGRHVEMLERMLGIALFERTLAGLKANPTALRLYEPVIAAHAALAEARILAAGAQPDPGGTVRITASAMVAHYVLPGILVPIRERYPAVSLEIVPTDSTENLLLREADIAIRMFRPVQLELVTRKLGDIAVVAAAHESYLQRRGVPTTIADLLDHDLIGFDRSDVILRFAQGKGWPLEREHFRLRSDEHTLLWELLRAGLGIGFTQEPLVRKTQGLQALLPELSIPPMEVWLTAHRELFTSHRIRAVYDALAEGFVQYLRE